jgi:autotransporter family porin
VKPRAETRPQNEKFNNTRGRQRLATNFFKGGDPRANSEIGIRVTGNYTGTTDEILQWAACKWGIDENVVRAAVAAESAWVQGAKGDWSAKAKRCAPGHGIGVDGRPGICPESWGLMQIKYYFYPSAWPGAVQSTAFNVDVAFAVWRACYEGYEWWLNEIEKGATYVAGDLWGCIGRWYVAQWQTPSAKRYVGIVTRRLSTRIWEQKGFR